MTPARPVAKAPLPAYALLLRGINIAGNKPVPMAELRRLLEGLGYADVRTLLNSGNVVLRGPAARPDDMARTLEAAMRRRFGFEVGCFVRGEAEWGRLIRANPYPAEAKRDPARLVLFLLDDKPPGKAVAVLRTAIAGPETVAAAGRQLWAYYPAGQGRSKLTLPLIERSLGTRGTGRNWNTVLKLAAMLGS